MNRLKFGFIISAVIVLIISYIFTFALGIKFSSDACKAVYLTTKILVTVLFIIAVGYALVSKAKTGSAASLLIISGVYLLLPLIIRLLVKSDINYKVAIAWSVSLICLAIYVVLIFGLSFQDKLMFNRDKMTEAHEIPVQQEKRLATDEDKESN